MNGTAREGCLSYGMKDWTDLRNKHYPYLVGGVNPGNLVYPLNSYVDRGVQRGLAYDNYVTAFDDGSRNWGQLGRSLESGKYRNMMVKDNPVHSFMSSKPTSGLNTKVVANPHHDKAIGYNRQAEPNKLLFINLPLKCTIRIFTIRGDLVKTIKHDNGTTEQSWNQITQDNQLIFSGVYIFYVESDMGNKIGKFVVVRSSRLENRYK